MKQLVQDLRTGAVQVLETPRPTVPRRGLLVRNLFSVISAGTERASVDVGRKGLLGKAMARPDLVRKVWASVQSEGLSATIQKVQARLDSYRTLGYSSAGIVVEVGAEAVGFAQGDIVACAGGDYAVHAEYVVVPQNLCARVPASVPPEWAVFATLGAIALQSIRQADARVGDSVAVIGLGIIGQLSVQLLKAAGCRVFGIDLHQENVALAQACGADRAVLRDDAGLEQAIAEFSQGRGTDAVLITASTKSNDPVQLAADILRDRGRIVVVGDVPVEASRAVLYEKELELRLSRSYGPGRYDPAYEEKGQDYPIGYVRWTEQRNIEAFLDLLDSKKLDIKKLITHRFPIDRAVQAYELLLGERTEFHVAILLEYPTATEAGISRSNRVVLKETMRAKQLSQLRLGVIGAGNFCQTHLLPHLKAHPKVVLRGVATATAARSRKVADKYGFHYCTTDAREVIEDPETDAVVIATRHDLHAALTATAMRAGKAVFTEKPLALTHTQLADVVAAAQESEKQGQPPRLMVGFNRRFAPLLRQMLSAWGNKEGPWLIQYRVNAGPLPPNHWLLDSEQGGGRLLGEVCHFIDFLMFLAQAPVARVFAEQLSGSGLADEWNILLTLKFSEGSAGSVNYQSVGDPSFAKERVEWFGQGGVGVIDDFRSGSITSEGKMRKFSLWKQDKGHREEIRSFVEWLSGSELPPIPLDQIVATSLATLRALESLRSGKPIAVEA